MEDIIIIWSQKSKAAELWVTYLNTCFDQIRKNRDKPPFRILSIAVEDIDDKTPMSPVLESKLRQARLEIVIVCPVFLEHILQYPERACKMASHLQPKNVLAMLLGLEEKSLTEQHRTALISFSQWKKMESVKDRDESFVSDFLGAAMQILGRTPTKPVSTPEKDQFMLVPKKVNQCQKKVVIVLVDPFEKDDVVRVSIVRNGQDVEVAGVVRRNPYTLAFRVPDVYLGLTTLVSVRVTRNGQDLGSRQLKCESQLHTLEQALKGQDQPLHFVCQALNIVPTDKAKLDEFLVKAFQLNVPNSWNILQSSGLDQVPRGAVSKDEYPTLLHWAARFGLEQLCWCLVECPGGDVACELRNNQQLTPAEMAEAAGHKRLSNLLCGYMQMSHFSNAYAFLKGMVDGKPAVAEEYLNPRPLLETYQVPPCPRPCPPSQTPPPLGYMPMFSPLGRQPTKPNETRADDGSDETDYSRERLCRGASAEPNEEKTKNCTGNGIEEELIEIINDFKNNVFTISEVEDLVNQWRRRNDVQQSFREKKEHLAKLREEYERVQQRMKEEMTQVGRPSPMERIRSFFRGKNKDNKNKEKGSKKRLKEEVGSPRPASSLSILSSSSSSSGRLSTASGGSLGDSGLNSDPECERRLVRPTHLPLEVACENYDIPPSPVSFSLVAESNYDVPPSCGYQAAASNYDIPPSPVELALACAGVEYCNLPPIPNESTLHGKASKPGLKTVVEEEKKTDTSYTNLGGPLIIVESENDVPTSQLPDYVNVETQGIQLPCN